MRGMVLFAVGVVLSCEARVAEPEPRPTSAGTLASTPNARSAKDALPAATASTTARASSTAATSASAPEPAASSSARAGPRCVDETTPRRATPKRGPDAACPTDPRGNFVMRRGKVHFVEANTMVGVEIAERPAHRERGLMYRKELHETEGMLFVFEEERLQSFWMRNTCLPLDMLFIDRQGWIVGIEENVPTLNDDSYGPSCPATYVVEVNAGWSRRHGVRPGQRVRFEGL